MAALVPLWLTLELENPFRFTCSSCTTRRHFKQFNGRFHRGSDYCSANVRHVAPFNNDEVMLSLVDTQIFDFFTGRITLFTWSFYWATLKNWYRSITIRELTARSYLHDSIFRVHILHWRRIYNEIGEKHPSVSHWLRSRIKLTTSRPPVPSETCQYIGPLMKWTHDIFSLFLRISRDHVSMFEQKLTGHVTKFR